MKTTPKTNIPQSMKMKSVDLSASFGRIGSSRTKNEIPMSAYASIHPLSLRVIAEQSKKRGGYASSGLIRWYSSF